MECPCCGSKIGNPLAGAGIKVTCDGAPEEGEFIACTTCTIYEDFTPVDVGQRQAIEAKRAQLMPPAPVA